MSKNKPWENIKLKSVDELFKTSDELKPVVFDIEIERLISYPNQPFKPYTQDKLEELAEDIKQNGIYSPILVREIKGGYQILAGHNRVNAAKLVGLKTVPTIIKNANDDEAQLIMLNTNLNQREELLPSEKAKAYKMQMDTMKRQGQRTDLTSSPLDTKTVKEVTSSPLDTKMVEEVTSSPLDTKIDTGVEIGKGSRESRANVFRYIRLNYLIPNFLEMTDKKELPFRSAVELSYLSEEAQKKLEGYMQSSKIKTVSLEQAAEIRKLEEITDDKLNEIFGKAKKEKPQKAKTISFKIPTEYFAENLPDLTVDDEFMKWIAEKISDYANGKR